MLQHRSREKSVVSYKVIACPWISLNSAQAYILSDSNHEDLATALMYILQWMKALINVGSDMCSYVYS